MPTSDDDRPIVRCVGADVTFAELKARGVRTMAEAARLDCGINCGRCRPYIERMIETGETAFPAD